MDVRYVNPFIKSICNTLEMMCSQKTTVGRPALKTPECMSGSDVSSIIGFSGDAAGSVVLHFSFDTASKLASSFAGIDITPDHADFADALGELANMVAGGAKAQFEGLDVSISLPNVVVGKNHNVSASKTSPRIIIPCSCESGNFEVEVGMEIKKPTGVAAAGAASGANA